MATWQGSNGGLLAGIGGVNSNAPSVNDIGNTLQLIRQNNDIERSGANNVGLTALQGLSGIAGVFQQEKQAQRQKEFQQAYANAYASGDRGALRQLATQYPDQIESVRKGMGFIDEDQRNSIGTLAAGARLASSSPEAMQSWLQNNAKELTRVGVDPNNVAQMYQQNPSGFGEFVDHLGMAALGPIDYFNVQDKMAGREIDRGRLAETIRSNQAGEALQARGQNLSYQSAMTGHNIAAQRLALDQQEFGFKMQQAQEKAQQLISEAPKLSVNMEKGIETAVNNATASSNSANSMSALAQQFRAEKPTTGLFGNAQNMFAKLTGSDTTLRDLRIRQNALVNSQVLKFLPPGPATDKDVEIVRQGAPTDMDNPETVARWLDAMANLERRNAQFNEFKAEWMSANG
ncbi:phage DNA ejection protein, partial [Escherichia coli]|nr:phage DNA ejection protein [Escherichia coli]